MKFLLLHDPGLVLGIMCLFIIGSPIMTYNVKIIEIKFFFRDIHTATGKIKRAVLQFTPSSWTPVRWLDPNCTYMRFVAICQLVIFWQVSELNTFFLKHIFEMPPSHPIVVARLFFVGIVVAPSVRYISFFVTLSNLILT